MDHIEILTIAGGLLPQEEDNFEVLSDLEAPQILSGDDIEALLSGDDIEALLSGDDIEALSHLDEEEDEKNMEKEVTTWFKDYSEDLEPLAPEHPGDETSFLGSQLHKAQEEAADTGGVAEEDDASDHLEPLAREPPGDEAPFRNEVEEKGDADESDDFESTTADDQSENDEKEYYESLAKCDCVTMLFRGVLPEQFIESWKKKRRKERRKENVAASRQAVDAEEEATSSTSALSGSSADKADLERNVCETSSTTSESAGCSRSSHCAHLGARFLSFFYVKVFDGFVHYPELRVDVHEDTDLANLTSIKDAYWVANVPHEYLHNPMSLNKNVTALWYMNPKGGGNGVNAYVNLTLRDGGGYVPIDKIRKIKAGCGFESYVQQGDADAFDMQGA